MQGADSFSFWFPLDRATLGEIGNKMWQVRSSRSNISYTDLRLLKVLSYQFLRFCSIVFSTQEKLLDLKMATSRSFDSGLTEIERIWKPRGTRVPHAPLRSTTPGHHPTPRRKDHWPPPPPPPPQELRPMGGRYIVSRVKKVPGNCSPMICKKLILTTN